MEENERVTLNEHSRYDIKGFRDSNGCSYTVNLIILIFRDSAEFIILGWKKSYANHDDQSLTSVCASLALSTFCASAQTLRRGTARCGSCDFPSLSLSLPSLSAGRQHYIMQWYTHTHADHYPCQTTHIIRQ